MRGKNPEIIFAFLVLITALQGCTRTSESNVNITGEANQSVQISNANTQNSLINSSNIRIDNASMSNGNFAPATNQKATSKMPETKIGSGGNDLAVIMMVRGKLSSDKNLINNVFVEVKEGNATLTGKVANEDQKKKAEELTKSVEGIKSVKNNLRVAP